MSPHPEQSHLDKQSHSDQPHSGGSCIATLSSASIVVTECLLYSTEHLSPFVVLPSDIHSTQASSVSIVSSPIQTTSFYVPTYVTVLSSTESTTVSISQTTIDNQSLLSQTGLGLKPMCSQASQFELQCLTVRLSALSSTNTTSNPKSRRCLMPSLSQVLVDSSIKQSSNHVYGTVLHDINLANGLLCQNTTFSDSTISLSTAWPGPLEYSDASFKDGDTKFIYSHYDYRELHTGPMTQTDIQRNQPIIFRKCTFTDMYSQRDMEFSVAGALFLYPTASVLIDTCTFSRCRQPDGPDLSHAGAILIMNKEGTDVVSTITNSHFEDCSGHLGTCHIDDTTLQVFSSSFNRNQGYSGSCISINPYAKVVMLIVDSTFEGNEATQAGGALHFCGNVSFSSFESNRASFGGALFFLHSTALTHCSFANNLATSPDGGNDVCGIDDFTYQDSYFVGCVSESDSLKFAIQYDIPDPEKEAHLPSPSEIHVGTIFVQENGTGSSCTQDAPCGSLASALVFDSSTSNIEILSGTVSETINFDSSLIVTGLASKNSFVPFTTLCLCCSISTATNLVVKTMSMTPHSESHPIFTVSSGGSLTIHKVRFDDIKNHKSQLILISDGEVTITNCTFENITGNIKPLVSVSGTAQITCSTLFFFSLTNEDAALSIAGQVDINMTDLIFIDVTRTKGQGAATFDVDGGNVININNIGFRRCSSTGSTCAVVVHDQEALSQPTLSYFTFQKCSSTSHPACDMDMSGYSSDDVEYFASSFTSTSQSPLIRTSDHTVSIPYPINVKYARFCHLGDQFLSAPNIPYSDADVLPIKEVIQKNAHLNYLELEFIGPTDSPFYVQPVSACDYVRLYSQSSVTASLQQDPAHTGSLFTVDENKKLAFEFLNLVIDADNFKPFIDGRTSSTVEVHDCVVLPDATPVNRAFVHALGTFLLDRCCIMNIHTTQPNGIYVADGEFRHNGITSKWIFNDPSDVINCSSKGNGFVHVKSCEVTFNGALFMSCSSQNGGAVFLDSPTGIQHQQVRFVGCTATENGGGCYVKLTESIQLMPVAFENCSAQKGGGLYVHLSDNAEFSMQEHFNEGFHTIHRYYYTFDGCSSLQQGGAMFIDGSTPKPTCLSQFTENTVSFSNNKAGEDASSLFISKSVLDQLDDLERSQLESGIAEKFWSVDDFDPTLQGSTHVCLESSQRTDRFNIIPFIPINSSTHSPEELFYQQRCTSFDMVTQLFHLKHSTTGEYIPLQLSATQTISCSPTTTMQEQYFEIIQDPCYGPCDGFDTYYEAIQWNISDPDYYYDMYTNPQPFIQIHREGTLKLTTVYLSQMDYPHCIAELFDSTSHIIFNRVLFEPVYYTPHSFSFVTCRAGTVEIDASMFRSDGVRSDPIDEAIFDTPLIVLAPPPAQSNSDSTTRKLAITRTHFDSLSFDSCPIISVDHPSCIEFVDNVFDRIKNEQDSTLPIQHIHVTGSNLWEVIDPSKWSGLPQDFHEDTDPLYWTSDPSSPQTYLRSQTLLVYLIKYTNVHIYTHRDGIDASFCGKEELPCRSLEEAVTHLISGPDSMIIVSDGSLLASEAVFSLPKSQINSEGETSTLHVSSNAHIVHKLGSHSSKLTVSSIRFNLPPTLLSSALVSVNGGSFHLDSCAFSAVSIAFSLVQVQSGSLNVLHVTLSSQTFTKPPFVLSSFTYAGFNGLKTSNLATPSLITAVGTGSSSNVEFDDCVVAGIKSSTPLETGAEPTCAWETGWINLKNCNTSLETSRFSEIEQGAFFIDGGIIDIETTNFHENGVQHKSFPSVRQNLMCVGAGQVNFKTLEGGDGSSSSSLWSSGSTCSFTTPTNVASFALPDLNNKSTSCEYNRKNKVLSFNLVGSSFVPCDLTLEVFIGNSKSNSDSVVTIPLSLTNTLSWEETHVSFTLNSKDITLSAKEEWTGRLTNTDRQYTDTFLVKPNASVIAQQGMKDTMKWLIPLIISLCVLAVVAIALIVLLRRRQKSKKKDDVEMPTIPEVEEDKVEVVEHDMSVSTSNIVPQASSNVPADPSQGQTQQHPESSGSCIDVVRCGPAVETVAVNVADTLYQRLHSGKPKAIDRISVRARIAQAMAAIGKVRPNAEILPKLNPHWIIFDSKDQPCLLLNESQLSQVEQNEQNKNANYEGLRWEAPEVAASREIKQVFNPSKASVFSLGLILWEIETGLVPFAELDAQNAQRQLSTGQSLKMAGVEENLQELIQQCLQVNPDDRPTLAEVSTFFISPHTKTSE
ncbi:hypothetical protein BLNAU_7623 [Blattamonas nauphoetae]|uniref:Protein kinase domain-containing protein n=1 Tax=Blattamonas nauphoetae TaxID=2049346 RepID=A0ABQ9Y142_9EUKA|nr:hypothetical protein BLNAU_7623 [Blattamonas nauphoetae]